MKSGGFLSLFRPAAVVCFNTPFSIMTTARSSGGDLHRVSGATRSRVGAWLGASSCGCISQDCWCRWERCLFLQRRLSNARNTSPECWRSLPATFSNQKLLWLKAWNPKQPISSHGIALEEQLEWIDQHKQQQHLVLCSDVPSYDDLHSPTLSPLLHHTTTFGGAIFDDLADWYRNPFQKNGSSQTPNTFV